MSAIARVPPVTPAASAVRPSVGAVLLPSEATFQQLMSVIDQFQPRLGPEEEPIITTRMGRVYRLRDEKALAIVVAAVLRAGHSAPSLAQVRDATRAVQGRLILDQSAQATVPPIVPLLAGWILLIAEPEGTETAANLCEKLRHFQRELLHDDAMRSRFQSIFGPLSPNEGLHVLDNPVAIGRAIAAANTPIPLFRRYGIEVYRAKRTGSKRGWRWRVLQSPTSTSDG